MKNLYKKGKVHPSPPPPSPPSTVHQYFSLLPPAILTLAAALSPQEAEVLAYLISCCPGRARTTHNSGDHRGGDDGGGGDHSPMFGCNCFRCYMSFWARWDASPNRQVIHEIIEAYEEGLLQIKKMRKNVKKKKEKGKKVCDERKEVGSCDNNQEGSGRNDLGELESAEPSSGGGGGCGQPEGGVADTEMEKGTVRKIASFVGEKIWGVWSRD